MLLKVFTESLTQQQEYFTPKIMVFTSTI